MYPQIFPQYYPQNQQQNMNTIVSVRSEAEARNYPVAYGATVYFKDESAPFFYTKSMGFSQMEAPRFEKYSRIETVEEPQTVNSIPDELNERIEAISTDIEALKKEVFKKKAKEVSNE